MASSSSKKCFICLSQLSTKVRKQVVLLKSQLDAIFILRHILEFSSELLWDCLRRCGNPGEWMYLCRKCNDQIQEIKTEFLRLHQLKRKFEKCKWEVQEQIRNARAQMGSKKKKTTPGPRRLRKIEEVEEEEDDVFELRALFCARGSSEAPSGMNPFSDGDLKAGVMERSKRNQENEDPLEGLMTTTTTKIEPPFQFQELQEDEDFYEPFIPVSLSISEPEERESTSSDPIVTPTSTAGQKVRRGRGRPKSVKTSKCLRMPKRRKVSREHLSRTDLTCEICKKGPFRSWPVKRKHVRQTHEKTSSVNCPHCWKTFINNSSLRSHLFRLHGIGNYCTICQKFFDTSAQLDEHKFKFHDSWKYLERSGGQWQCKICGHQSTDDTALNRHLAHMHKLGDYLCEMCSEVFTSKKGLTKHKERSHASPDALKQLEMTCDQCGCTYKNKDSLTNHIKQLHARAYQQTCEICGITTVTAWKMKLHMQINHVVSKY